MTRRVKQDDDSESERKNKKCSYRGKYRKREGVKGCRDTQYNDIQPTDI